MNRLRLALKALGVAVLGTLMLGVFATACQAQGRSTPVKWDDSSGVSIVANFRAGRMDPTSILRQEKGAIPRAILDILADSLVSIALEAPDPKDVVARRRSDGIIATLTESGSRSTKSGGTPYAGALERLIRMEKTSTDPQLRRAVNDDMVGVGAIDQAVAHLTTVATSNDAEVAPSAMWALVKVLDPLMMAYQHSTPAERQFVRTELKKLWEASKAPGKLEAMVPMARMGLARAATIEKWN